MYKIKHKFGAKRTKSNGRSYSSKLEASYASRLDVYKSSGALLFWLEQVPFRLPGDVIYRLDFMEFWAPKEDSQGDVVFTEVKGFDTSMGKLKIKQMEEIYEVKINIVRR